VKLSVNGEERNVAEGLTVARLLEMMKVPTTGTAVARNDRVVRRDEHGGTRIEEGDRIEIIRTVAGG
jgi:sulfur carrier protein